MKTAILSLLMIAASCLTAGTASAADALDSAAVTASCGTTDAAFASADATASADALDLNADLAQYPYYWYALGCVRYPQQCLNRARRGGFYFWNAVQDPFQCGYYALACYGRY